MKMPPAAEKLVADLKAAASAASQLEAAEPDADRASLLVGLRDMADYAARVLVAFYGPDRRYTVQKAHLLRAAAGQVLNDAEVLDARGTEVPEPAPVLDLERTESHSVTRTVQRACDRCTQGVMDANNPHLWGACLCPCHSAASSRAPQIHGEPRSEGAVGDCLADPAPTQGSSSTEAPASDIE
jgi:hypothetical protein